MPEIVKIRIFEIQLTITSLALDPDHSVHPNALYMSLNVLEGACYGNVKSVHVSGRVLDFTAHKVTSCVTGECRTLEVPRRIAKVHHYRCVVLPTTSYIEHVPPLIC